jgi:hypothetical protein
MGDYVWTHLNFLNQTTDDPPDTDIAGVEIFKMDAEGGAIEHWDALQVVGGPNNAVPWFAPNVPGVRDGHEADDARPPRSWCARIAPRAVRRVAHDRRRPCPRTRLLVATEALEVPDRAETRVLHDVLRVARQVPRQRVRSVQVRQHDSFEASELA